MHSDPAVAQLAKLGSVFFKYCIIQLFLNGICSSRSFACDVDPCGALVLFELLRIRRLQLAFSFMEATEITKAFISFTLSETQWTAAIAL